MKVIILILLKVHLSRNKKIFIFFTGIWSPILLTVIVTWAGWVAGWRKAKYLQENLHVSSPPPTKTPPCWTSRRTSLSVQVRQTTLFKWKVVVMLYNIVKRKKWVMNLNVYFLEDGKFLPDVVFALCNLHYELCINLGFAIEKKSKECFISSKEKYEASQAFDNVAIHLKIW